MADSRSEILDPNRAHHLAVDMWSIGILSAQLLMGYEQFEALADLSRVDPEEDEDDKSAILENVMFEIEQTRDECTLQEARDFIRNCLFHNPAKRMTAKMALQHPWLCTPEEDLQLFLRRERETSKFWKPRPVFAKIIETIPDMAPQRPRASEPPPDDAPEEGQNIISGRSICEVSKLPRHVIKATEGAPKVAVEQADPSEASLDTTADGGGKQSGKDFIFAVPELPKHAVKSKKGAPTFFVPKRPQEKDQAKSRFFIAAKIRKKKPTITAPQKSRSRSTSSKKRGRSRRGSLPDMGISPTYIGLEKYLRPTTSSETRKDVLAALAKTGEMFLTQEHKVKLRDEKSSPTPPERNSSKKRKATMIS